MWRHLFTGVVLWLLSSTFVYGQKTKEKVLDVRLNEAISYQTIDNFGASDCWILQHLGKTASDSILHRAADFLFSLKKEKNGNPKGIGLSIWRFNIGAGSADNPHNKIDNPWRQTPCMLDSVGNFDTHRQSGQLRFLKAAQERKCPQFLGFCNSPPYFMTQNRQAFNMGRSDNSLNLREDQYNAFARFLVQVYQGLKREHHITLDYISPFNEPEWDWRNPSQEGTPCSTAEMARLYRILDRELTQAQIPEVTIIGTECAHLKYMYSQNTDKPFIENQIDRLYSPASPDYIGELAHVTPTIIGHSYWTTQMTDLIPVRTALRKKLDEHKLRFWQSELCIMSNDREIGAGGGRDLTMKTALYVARVIHHDLTLANASAWQWWLAISNSDYKDGLLYIDDDLNRCEHIYDSKLLWTLGNYSRFIRPEATRIGVEGYHINNPYGVMISAYRNRDGSIAVVAVNYSESRQPIHLLGTKKKKAKAYITSDNPGDNLRYLGVQQMTETQYLPPRSVVTYVIP